MRNMRLLVAPIAVCLSTSGRAQEMKWQDRTAAYKPYDGSGRYTSDRDDGVRGTQGLAILASRFGVKPYAELLGEDGVWQTERVIFRDVDTGATVMRLTNDPWADELSYFKGNWSADGKIIVFRRRPGMWESSTPTHGPMAMKSDGTALRNVFRDYPMVRKAVCSPTEPDICYAMAADKTVVAFDLATGKTHHVVRDVPGCWHLKVSPDGRHLMGRSDITKGGKGLWIVSSDGKEYHEISIPDAIHDSYQFHPSQKKVMFWYEGRYRTEGFVQCDFDGGGMTKVNVLFDWNHGDVGLDRGAHTVGYITRIEGDTWLAKEPLFAPPGAQYYDDPADANGYLTWSPKDQLWVYSTRILRRPYVSEIHAFRAEPAADKVVNRYRVCYTALKRPGCLDNPGASPDGTKVLFNSNMLDSVDAYCVVARLPEPPRALGANRAADGIRLTWQPASHHAETAGYHVYRSRESGVGYVPITARPVPATEFIDHNSQPAVYAVSAVEHAGLESGLSEEASANLPQPWKRRIFVEAEQGIRDPRMWLAFQGLASGLHYVWMRGRVGEGRLVIPINLPRTDSQWTAWARVRGEKKVQFVFWAGDNPVPLKAPPSARWAWAKAEGTLALKPGPSELVLSSSTYGSAVDCLFLTDDAGFSPDASPRFLWPELAAPEGLKAEAASPYSVRLSWQSVAGAQSYNLYCGRQAGFTPDQSALIASPEPSTSLGPGRDAFLDWGLRPGETLFYRVTCVGRVGNESPPSAAAQATTPTIGRVVIEKDPADSIVFDAPRKDTYVVWLKLKQGPQGGQYITVKVDGKPGGTWTCAFDKLSDDSWFTYDQWGRFALGPGNHTLTIENKTRHLLTKVLLTNDLSLKPGGHVNILSGW